MSGRSFFKNSALGALAIAMIATALPATAFAQDQQRQERGGRSWGGGEGQRGGGQRGDRQRGGGQRMGGEVRTQATVQAQVQAPQVRQPRVIEQGQSARVERPAMQSWQGRGTTDNGQRGSVPAQRTATPQTAERGWDGNRWNGSSAGRTDGRTESRSDGRTDGRTYSRDTNRDSNRDRNWNNNDRDRGSSWNGRNSSYQDNNRNRDYRSGTNYRSNDRDGQRRWNNDWRRDQRYNWSSYRNSNRNFYRLPRYNSPYRGYSYSRLSIGFFLNSGFYGNNYWINDPWAYRLPPAYSGYRWVRYYDDVLLVDTYSGQVVDVIYSFFW